MRATCPNHLILDLITLKLLGEDEDGGEVEAIEGICKICEPQFNNYKFRFLLYKFIVRFHWNKCKSAEHETVSFPGSSHSTFEGNQSDALLLTNSITQRSVKFTSIHMLVDQYVSQFQRSSKLYRANASDSHCTNPFLEKSVHANPHGKLCSFPAICTVRATSTPSGHPLYISTCPISTQLPFHTVFHK